MLQIVIDNIDIELDRMDSKLIWKRIAMMLLSSPKNTCKFLSGPSLTQACCLVFLYGSFAFILFYQLNTDHQSMLSFLISYSDFMVGVSTVIAALAAIHGVNNWVKHVKHAEYFKLIWEAKKSLGMYRFAYLNWSQQRGIFYSQNKELDVSRHMRNTEILETRKENLLTTFFHLDAIFSKGEFDWACSSRDLISTVNQYKSLLLKDEVTHEDNEKSRQLINNINEHYEKIFHRLDVLEQNYSR